MLEQEIASTNLLFKEGLNGKYNFVHNTWLEFFAAKYFADKINSGLLSVDEAYRDYWTYVEDKALWRLEDLSDDECRVLLPAYRPMLPHFASFVQQEKFGNLVEIIGNNYLKCKEHLHAQQSNPLADDLFLVVGQVGQAGIGIIDKVLEILEITSRDSFRENRQETARCLDRIARLGYPKALELLIDIMRDDDSGVSYVAQEILGGMDKRKTRHPVRKRLMNPEAIKKFDYLIKDEDSLAFHFAADFMRDAERALSRYKDGEYFCLPYGLFDKERNGNTLAEAVEWARDPANLRKLLRRLRHSDFETRYSAAYWLAFSGNPNAVEPLMEAYKDEYYSHVREQIISALGQIGDKRAFATLMEAAKWELSQRAMSYLAELHCTDAKDILAGIASDTKHHYETRANAAISLSKIFGKEAIPYLLPLSYLEAAKIDLSYLDNVKKKSKSSDVPKRALVNDDKEYIDYIAKTPDGHLEQQQNPIDDIAYIDYISQMFDDPHINNIANEHTSYYIATGLEHVLEALAEVREPSLLPHFRRIMDYGSNYCSIAAKALGLIGLIGNDYAYELLEGLLISRKYNCEGIIKGLELIKKPDVVDTLRNHLWINHSDMGDYHLCPTALEALGRIGGKEILHSLLILTENADIRDKTHLYKAIHSIHERIKPQGFIPPAD
jgi:HEAT repeat protein